jgi:shikimate dehydrogenase
MSEAPPLAGVVGWPIGHSRSPILHGHWLRRYRVTGYYAPLEVAPADLPDALALLPRLGFRGVNVTIPHKEAALARATDVSERARRIGAANTLTFLSGGGFHADNTDGIGFLANLRQERPGWSAASGPALVVGAGGAARAVIDALLTDGAPDVRIANRTRARAEALVERAGPRARAIDWRDVGAAMEGAATIVNATSLGMAGQPPLDLAFDCAPQTALATDLVYQPLLTPFLGRAAEAGLATVDGLGMLLHQAVPGHAAWFGVTPEVDDDLRDAVLAAGP